MTLIKPQPWWPGCDVLDPLCPDQAWPLWEGAGSAVEAVGRDVGDSRQYRGIWNGTGSRWAQGLMGTVAQFNGTDDYVDLTRLAGQFPSDKPFSVECVVKRTGPGTQVTNHNTLVTTYRTGNSGWTILWSSVNNRFECYTYGSGGLGYAHTGNGSISIDIWYHVVLVFHGGTTGNVSAYLDGQFKQVSTSNHGYIRSYHPTVYTGNLGAGFAVDPPTDFWEGDMAGVWSYGWALSPRQIAERYRDQWRSMRARRAAILRIPAPPLPIGDEDPGADAAEVFMGGSHAGEVFIGGTVAGEIHG